MLQIEGQYDNKHALLRYLDTQSSSLIPNSYKKIFFFKNSGKYEI